MLNVFGLADFGVISQAVLKGMFAPSGSRYERASRCRDRKARGHVLRLSCILEHLWWSGDRIAQKPTWDHSVQRAAGLVEGYFLPMVELGRVLISAGIGRMSALGAKRIHRNGSSDVNDPERTFVRHRGPRSKTDDWVAAWMMIAPSSGSRNL